MTGHEAFERAAHLWGRDRLISVHRRDDGGAEVNLRPMGKASDTRGRTWSAHRLDAHGHPVCHDDCRTLEG